MRLVPCAAFAFSCGCLMANPEYWAETATDSGGGGASSSAAATGPTSSSDGSQGAGSGSAATSSSLPGSSTSGLAGTTSSSGESSTGELGDEFCADSDTLMICLQFDVETPADIIDESSLAHPFAVSGGGLVDSPWGRALHHNASTEADVDCMGDCVGGPFVTYEAWVRVAVFPTEENRAGIVDKDGFMGMFVTDTQALRCVTQGGTVQGGSIELDTWVHVACVLDGDVAYAYVDGAMVGERNIDPSQPVDSLATVAIGNNAPNPDDPLDGDLDRVRVWTEARTAVQIAESATP